MALDTAIPDRSTSLHRDIMFMGWGELGEQRAADRGKDNAREI